MKKSLLITLLHVIGTIASQNVFAQAPEMFNYQGVARDADGNALAGKEVALRIAIMSEAEPDRPLYAEEHLVTTNKLGLFNLAIGGGEVLEGAFNTIDWGAAAHYLSVQMETEGFGNFEQMGTSQLLSVPYALYAARSGNADPGEDGGTRSDPNDWTMSGNSGTDDASNFLGTTDEQDLAIRTNDTEVARFTTDGDLDLADGSRILVNGENLLNALGTSNVHIGKEAGGGSTGIGNVLVGEQSGQNLSTGSYNMLLGYRSGRFVTTGSKNIGIGYGSGLSTTTGDDNTYLGQFAGALGTTATDNVFIGSRSGYSNQTGIRNTAIGKDAGRYLSNSSYNAFIGYRSGHNTTTGNNNSFIGYASGLANTTGGNNTFIGRNSGDANTTGSNNTYIGRLANGTATLTNATAIGANASVAQDSSVVLGNNAKVGIGTSAPDADLHLVGALKVEDGTQAEGYVLTSDTDGNASWQAATIDTLNLVADADADTKIQVEESTDEDIIRFDMAGTEFFRMDSGRLEVVNTGNSVFIGNAAGANDDYDQKYNIFIGDSAGYSNTSGGINHFLGYRAGYSNTTGLGNFFSGYEAGYSNTSGQSNIFYGLQSGYSNTTGSNNIFMGASSGSSNTTGTRNVFLGYLTGQSNTSGIGNVLLGYYAGRWNVTGDHNVYLGTSAGEDATGSQNVFIGYSAGMSETGDNRLYIENSDADSSEALIYGEFDNDFLAINGTLSVNEAVVGNIDIGSESWIQSVSAQPGNGYLTTPWLYTTAIEAAGDRGASSTAIILGDNDVFSTEDQIHLITNGTDRLMVNADGRVGINTDTPDALLHVVGAMKLEDGTEADGYVLTSDADGNASWQQVNVSGDNLGDHTATQNIELDDNWLSNDGGNEGIQIGNTGLVGINTSPLSSTELTLGSDDSPALRFHQDNSGSFPEHIWETGGNEVNFYIRDVTDSKVPFRIFDNGLEDGINIDSDGIAINGTNASAILDVNGTSEFNGTINTVGNWISGDGGNEGIHIANDGDVGIGDNSPDAKLHVAGTFKLEDGSQANGYVLTSDADGNATWQEASAEADTMDIIAKADGESYVQIRDTSNLDFVEFTLQGQERMRLTASGLGIGTKTPSADLDVNGSLEFNGVLNTNSNWISGDGDVEGITVSAGGDVGIGLAVPDELLHVNGTAEFEGNIKINGNWITRDGDDEGIAVSSSGNVGIGIGSPAELLHVNGTSEFEGNITTNGNWISGDGGNEGISVSSSGNVGIGTSNPQHELQVYDPNNDNSWLQLVQVSTGNTQGDGLVIGVNSSEEANFINKEATNMNFQTDQITRMVIEAGGNVGIGDDTPSYKLQVNGQVAGTSSYVNTSDAKYKTNVQRINSALEKLLRLEGVSYDWKTKDFPDKKFDNRHQLGFIAQDVEGIVPEAVSITEEGDYGLSYSTFIPLLVEAVKQLNEENEKLKYENESLKAENTSQEERLQRIEELLQLDAKAQR